MQKIQIKNSNCTTILTVVECGQIDIVILSNVINDGLIALKPIKQESFASILRQDLLPWPTKNNQIVIFQKGSLCHIEYDICINLSKNEEVRDLIIPKVLIEFP